MQEDAQKQQAALLDASQQLQGDAERGHAAVQAHSQEIIGLRAAAELEIQRTRGAAHHEVQAMRLRAHAEQEQLAEQGRNRARHLEQEARENDAQLRLELNRVQEEALRSVGQLQRQNLTVDDHRAQEIAETKKKLDDTARRADDEANEARSLRSRSHVLDENLKAS